MQPELKSGDKVVPLAGLTRTSAIIAGAVNGALLMWIAERSLLLSGEALLGGALLGFVLGSIVGRTLFPAASGQILVVKAARSSMGQTVKAATAGAILISVAVALIVKTVTSPAAPISIIMIVALAVGATIGILWGTLAPLL